MNPRSSESAPPIDRSIDLACGRSPDHHPSPRSFHHTVRVRVHVPPIHTYTHIDESHQEYGLDTYTPPRVNPTQTTRSPRRPVAIGRGPNIHIPRPRARSVALDRGKSDRRAVKRASISIASRWWLREKAFRDGGRGDGRRRRTTDDGRRRGWGCSSRCVDDETDGVRDDVDSVVVTSRRTRRTRRWWSRRRGRRRGEGRDGGATARGRGRRRGRWTRDDRDDWRRARWRARTWS